MQEKQQTTNIHRLWTCHLQHDFIYIIFCDSAPSFISLLENLCKLYSIVSASSGAVALLCGLHRGSEQEWLPAAAEARGLHSGAAGVRPRHEAPQQEPPGGPTLPQEEAGLHLQSAVWDRQAGTKPSNLSFICRFSFADMLMRECVCVFVCHRRQRGRSWWWRRASWARWRWPPVTACPRCVTGSAAKPTCSRSSSRCWPSTCPQTAPWPPSSPT